jgi:hypothetical protein
VYRQRLPQSAEFAAKRRTNYGLPQLPIQSRIHGINGSGFGDFSMNGLHGR